MSSIQYVLKKGGVTIIVNKKNEFAPIKIIIGWRVCIVCRKLNKAIRKDRFPFSFEDQMLDRIAGKEYYCYLDGYSSYNHIAIALEDQDKTTFTYLYGNFTLIRMLFRLCNAPATFQRCIMSIFSDMVE